MTLSNFRETPEEKEIREAKEIAKKEQAKIHARKINQAYSTADGRYALKWLMELSGYQVPSVVVDPQSGEVQVQSTIYNEARRNLYITVRRCVNSNVLASIENYGLVSEGEGEDDIFS